jgi:hypothetical protein
LLVLTRWLCAGKPGDAPVEAPPPFVPTQAVVESFFGSTLLTRMLAVTYVPASPAYPLLVIATRSAMTSCFAPPWNFVEEGCTAIKLKLPFLSAGQRVPCFHGPLRALLLASRVSVCGLNPLPLFCWPDFVIVMSHVLPLYTPHESCAVLPRHRTTPTPCVTLGTRPPSGQGGSCWTARPSPLTWRWRCSLCSPAPPCSTPHAQT